MTIVLLLLVATQSGVAPQQRNDTRTWYQAYADAQQNAARGNWEATLNDLDAAARRGAPMPGRNVLFYGDVYRNYNPDYYRGLAYSNLKRYDEANQAFDRVRQAQLIGPRDLLYAEFTRQATLVADTLKKQPPQDRTPATSNVAEAAPGRAPATSNVAPAPPTVVQSPGGQPPSAAPPNAPGATSAASAAPSGGTVVPPPAIPSPPRPGPITSANKPGGSTAAVVRPSAAVIRPSAGVAPNSGPMDERRGVLQFFSGDYEAAASSLALVTSSAGASPRAYFYLACARAALVLTGKAPRNAMEDARAQLALAGDNTQFAPDRRFISPRIRQELGMQP